MLRAEAHGDDGDRDKAIADYTEAIRLAPKCAEAYTNRGISYYEKGEQDKAIADYTEAIRLDPKCAEGAWRDAGVRSSYRR
jgi:tetratricopeptide (TPR) repeat protein